MGEFVRTQVVPEMDAYILSKLAAHAVSKSQTVTGTPASQAYKMMTDAVGKVQNAAGYDEELVAFVNSAMWTALQSTAELSRQLVVSDFRKGELNTRVQSLNGVAVLPVPDNRMKSASPSTTGRPPVRKKAALSPPRGPRTSGCWSCPAGPPPWSKRPSRCASSTPPRTWGPTPGNSTTACTTTCLSGAA